MLERIVMKGIVVHDTSYGNTRKIAEVRRERREPDSAIEGSNHLFYSTAQHSTSQSLSYAFLFN